MCTVLKFTLKELLKYATEKNSEADTKVDDNYESVKMRAKSANSYEHTGLELIEK